MDIKQQLDAVSALPDQKQRLEQYKALLQQLLEPADEQAAKAFLDHSTTGDDIMGGRNIPWTGRQMLPRAPPSCSALGRRPACCQPAGATAVRPRPQILPTGSAQACRRLVSGKRSVGVIIVTAVTSLLCVALCCSVLAPFSFLASTGHS